MNNKKILLGIVLGLLVISIVPAALGYTTVKRSLDKDWFRETDIMPRNNPAIGWWASEELTIFPNYDSNWNLLPIRECDVYYGHIIDREMPDGRHMIIVTINVKGAPVIVETYNPTNSFTLFIGKMNYLYQQKFIIDLDLLPLMLIPWLDNDEFEDETGYVILLGYYIPLVFGEIYPEMGLEFVSVHFIGIGERKLVNSWNGLEAGDTAKVNLGALGFATKGYELINLFLDIWALDFIKLY